VDEADGSNEMTKEEAEKLKAFENTCTCGGYAWSVNGRPEAQPHMAWCPQAAEYAEWYKAIHHKAPCKDRGCAAWL